MRVGRGGRLVVVRAPQWPLPPLAVGAMGNGISGGCCQNKIFEITLVLGEIFGK